MRALLIWWAVAACCASPGMGAAGEDAVPAPLSEAERQAVALVVDYLREGPPAVAARLAPEAPLALVPPDEALAEIEVRLGPPAGARWQLQRAGEGLLAEVAVFSVVFPSGHDETVLFELAPAAGWRVVEVRTLVDRVPDARQEGTYFDRIAGLLAMAQPRQPLPALVVLLPLLALSAMALRPRRRCAVATFALAAVLLSCQRTAEEPGRSGWRLCFRCGRRSPRGRRMGRWSGWSTRCRVQEPCALASFGP